MVFRKLMTMDQGDFISDYRRLVDHQSCLTATAASLLQSGLSDDIPAEKRPYYETLVSYYNSLRELGGALVVMQDDVRIQ